VIQDASWGWGPAANGKTLFTGFARSGGCSGGQQLHLPGGGGVVWGEYRQRGKWSQRWRATGSVAALPMGGRRPLRLTRERAWLLARIAEKPDLALRAVMAELGERGTPASDGAVWRFLKHEGISF
jgi:hypothetical protein